MWYMARFNRFNEETRLYRNKLTYYVGEAEDKVILIAHPTFFEIQIERTIKSMKNISKVCNEVRVTIEQSLEHVKSFVSASEQIFYHFAFYCRGEHSTVGSIAAIHTAVIQTPQILSEETPWPSNARCSITEHLHPLSIKQQLWFGNQSSVVSNIPHFSAL